MNKTLRRIADLISLAKAYSLVGNTRIAKHIAREGLEFVRKGKGCVSFPELDIAFDVKKQINILRRIQIISRLKREVDCKFEQTTAGAHIALIQGCRFNIGTGEEIVMLSEIFLDHNYDITLPCKSVVLDMGMNNGDSTLYFASRKNVDFVRGYEPFRPTFEAAEKNLSLNPALAARIDICNFGLGDREGELECDYSAENTAGAGVSGILGPKGNVSRQKIEIRSASGEVARIRQEFPDHSLVAKIDTEGSEFAIIESLDREKVLDQISVILLEWHEKSPAPITNALLKAGFVVFNTDGYNGRAGMLYAFNCMRN